MASTAECNSQARASAAATCPATATLVPASGIGTISLTPYRPGSNTAMIPASWIVPAGAQIASHGPVSARTATQRETRNLPLRPERASNGPILPGWGLEKTQSETRSLSLSPKLASNQAFLPAWGLEKTQSQTPGLSLSSGNAADSGENPTQTTISYTYDSLYRLTDAVYSNGFEFHYTYRCMGCVKSQNSRRECGLPLSIDAPNRPHRVGRETKRNETHSTARTGHRS